MKKTLFAMLAAMSAQCFAATSVSQYGITLEWTEDLTVGQYANGDYYIVAPSGATITSKTPASTSIDGRIKHGMMANPAAGISVQQGFDSSMAANSFNAALNRARPNGNDLSAENPLEVAPGTSLVASISRDGAGVRPQLSDAAVFTFVSEAPPANSMRPPYCGADKSPHWNADGLNFDILNNYSPVASTPSLATVDTYLVRPWIEIQTNWVGREMHPLNNQPDYGAAMANQVAAAMLSLHLSYTHEQKRGMYIRVTQYGIDVYGAAVTGGNWINNGGHNMGRKMPMLLAGLAFNDANILAYADANQHFIFQEDQQTFYIAAGDVALTNSAAWNPDLRGTDSTVTISNASPAVVSWANHGLRVNSMVKFTTTGTLPSPLAVGTKYYIASTGLDTNSFQISATQGPGGPINTTTDGSGIHEADAASPYVSDDIGVPEWGIRNFSAPNENNYSFTANYRDLNYNSLYGHALVAHFLDATDEWNWPAFFDYMDRSKAEMPQDGVYSTDFANNMWAAYRTPPTGPQLVSAVIGTGGTSVTYTFNVSVSIGAGGNGGMTASPSGGAATLTYASGAPGTELVYNLSRTILAGENVPGSYTQPGNGIEATVGGEDLTSIPDLLITNNSTYQIPAAMSNGSRQRLFPGGGGF